MQAKKRLWWTEPWTVEATDKNGFMTVPKRNPILGEDGDGEVLRDALLLQASLVVEEERVGTGQEVSESVDEDIESNSLHSMELEAQSCMRELVDYHEGSLRIDGNWLVEGRKIEPVVIYDGVPVYKSTLVSQLNDNPWLSKDRLSRVQNSIYFNSPEVYLHATSSASTCFLGLGSDCAIYFKESTSLAVSSSVKSAQKQHKNILNGKVFPNGKPCPITKGDKGTWWIGRVQKIRRKAGSKWGNSRVPVDLQNKPVKAKKGDHSTLDILLSYFSKTRDVDLSKEKSKSDHDT